MAWASFFEGVVVLSPFALTSTTCRGTRWQVGLQVEFPGLELPVMSVRTIHCRLASMNLVRSIPLVAWVTLLLSSSHSAASGEDLGGAHVGYSIGGSFAQQDSGLRHGLDLALLPKLFFLHHDGGGQGFESSSGLALGPSAIIGFGRTPDYLAFDFGYGLSTIVGGFAGGGPVYRFSSSRMPQGFGFEGRLAFDVLLCDAGLRIMNVVGDHSSEFAAMFFLGAGRF